MNNGARALEGLIARYFFDNDTSLLATLSGSVIQVTANRSSLTLTGTTSNYVANFLIAWTMGANPITGPASLNINAVGPISLRDNLGASLSSSIIVSGSRCLAVKDGTNDYFRLIYPDQTRDVYTDPLTTRGDLVVRDASSTTRFAIGGANAFLASTGTDPQWRSMAAQSDQETGTSATAPVVPSVQQFHQSAAKGWVDYNHVTPAISASYNVTSVTDNATGDLTVNWATDFSSAAYAFVISAEHNGTQKPGWQYAANGGQAAGTLNILAEDTGAAARDWPSVCVAAYGDLV